MKNKMSLFGLAVVAGLVSQALAEKSQEAVQAVKSVVKSKVEAPKPNILKDITAAQVPSALPNSFEYIVQSPLYLNLADVMNLIFNNLNKDSSIKNAAVLAAQGELKEAKATLTKALIAMGAVSSVDQNNSESFEIFNYTFNNENYTIVYVHGVDAKLRLLVKNTSPNYLEWIDPQTSNPESLAYQNLMATYVIYMDQALNSNAKPAAEQMGATLQSYELGSFNNKIYYGYLEPIAILDK